MAKDEKKSGDKTRKRGQLSSQGKGVVAEKKPKRGLNKFPGYLRNELGLHDFLASSVVIVCGGLALTGLVWFLSVVWPG